MATRLNLKHDEHTRAKIQTSQLVNRLNRFALDENDSVRMSSDQVRAALGLLKKTIPDLSVTSLNGGDGDNPIHLHLIAEQFVSAQLVQSPPTIVSTATEQPANLLDAPVPTE